MTRQNNKWDRRDKKREKKRGGMRISGRSVFILEEVIQERARRLQHDRERRRKQEERGE